MTDEERIQKQLKQKAKSLGQTTKPAKKTTKKIKAKTKEEAITDLDNGLES